MSIFDKINAGEYQNRTVVEFRKSDGGMRSYWAEEARLRAKFEDDLADELGIADNPKRDLLLEKAWSNGHSAGYSEVANIAVDLVELIEDPKGGQE